MTTNTLNKVAAGVSIAILCGWAIYWGVQIQDVRELLEMANMQ